MTGDGLRSTGPLFSELTLDQLLAEPIVRQVMHRDRIEEAATRQLLQQVARARPKAKLRRVLPETSSKDDPDTIVGLLHDIARLWRKLYDRVLRARIPGMTQARAAVIVHLAEHEGLTQVRLAESLNLKPITLVRLLDKLEGLDCIERSRVLGDRRAWRLHLTLKGRGLLTEIRAVNYTIANEVSAGVDGDDRVKLITMLAKLRQNLTR
jgi:MarR family transcriptional regulator for hemolysin